MAETHELRLKINASAAKAGAKEFSSALASVKQAVRQLDRDTTGAFTKLRKGAQFRVDTKSVKAASVDLNRAAAGIKRFQDAATRTSLSASSALRTSTGEARRLSAAFSEIGDTSGIVKIENELATLQRRLKSASTPLDVRVARNNFKGVEAELQAVNMAQKKAANSAQRHAESLDQLRAKYNPLFSASQQYEQSLAEINRAEREGIITAQLAANARKNAAAQLAGTTTATKNLAKSMGLARFQSQNVTAQLQDVFITAQMGMDPMRIAIQQGSQLSVTLNDMARSAGGVRGVLGGLVGGFTAMINPISLVTIGGIAAVAMLAQWAVKAFGAADKTKTFEDRLNSLKTLQSELSGVTDTLTLSVSELSKKYGDAAIRVQNFAAFQAQLKLAALTEKLAEQSNILRDVTGAYTTAATGGHEYRNTLNRLEKDFGLTRDAAVQFESILERAATAATFEKQVSALQDVKKFLNENGVAAANIPPQVAKALDKMIDLSNQTAATKKVAGDLAKAVADIAPNLNPAVATATALKQELAKALLLKNSLNNQESKVYSGRGGDPRKLDNGGQYTRQLNYQSPAALIKELSKPARGGGGSRASAINDEKRALDSLSASVQDRLTSLQTEISATKLLDEGRAQTLQTARLMAQVAANGALATDEATAAIFRQISALEKLQKTAKTPAQAWLDSVPTWKEAGQQIDAQVFKSLSTTIKDFARTGKLDVESFFAAMLDSALTTISQIATQELFSIFGGSGGGSGGFLGGLFGGSGGFLGGFFGAEEGGLTSAPVAANRNYAAPIASFRNAPSYAAGTANTSGIPAILHDNEAVIPLSRGRKVPVEMTGGQSGGGMVQNINMQINTPDADSFRKSQKQIAADAGMASRRAMKDIR